MLYTESHEWIKLDGKIGTIGITKEAQKELGEIVFIELPKIGDKLKVKEEFCVLESTKAAIDVCAPASGKVVDVNEMLKRNPSLINQDAEGEGWLCKIELLDPEELLFVKRHPPF